MRTVDPVKWPKKAKKRSPRGPGGLEARVRSSFCDAMQEYTAHLSVKGLGRAFDRTLTKHERCRHAIVYLACFSWGVWVACYYGVQLQRSPRLQVNLQTLQHSIQRVPFPAVALCSAATITRDPLDNYTRYLVSRNSTYSARSIQRNLLQFGSLHTLDLPSVDVGFEPYLARLDPTFDVNTLMHTLSSPCKAMLRRCSWRGQNLPCQRLFSTRATPLGFCCVFNSRYYSRDSHLPPRYLDMVGRDYGLQVILHENPDNFAYIRRASLGPDILIFDGSEYPILEGGGVRVYPVELNTSMFLSVSASVQRPRDQSVPGCHRRRTFHSPGQPAQLSYSWCLTLCRRRTLAALCSCLLHTMPPDDESRYPICSLTDLSCLNKHREKLIYYYPGVTDIALEEEQQNGQDCRECVPDCERYIYSATVRLSRYEERIERKIFRRNITEGKPMTNVSIIRLYYSSEHQKLFSVEANTRWYESFASMGSSWSGITGCTAVAACEVSFFFTVRWVHHYWRRTRGPR